jgi:hypothetical protein
MNKNQIMFLFIILLLSLTLISVNKADARIDPGAKSYSNCLVYTSNIFPLADYDLQEVVEKAENTDYITTTFFNPETSSYIPQRVAEKSNLSLNIENITEGRGDLRATRLNPYYYDVTLFRCGGSCSLSMAGNANIAGNAAYLYVEICENSKTLPELSASAVSELKKLGMLENDPTITFGAPMDLYSTAGASGGGYNSILPAGIDPIILIVISIVAIIIVAALILKRFL